MASPGAGVLRASRRGQRRARGWCRIMICAPSAPGFASKRRANNRRQHYTFRASRARAARARGPLHPTVHAV